MTRGREDVTRIWQLKDEGKPVREIAQVVGCSENTVRGWLSRPRPQPKRDHLEISSAERLALWGHYQDLRSTIDTWKQELCIPPPGSVASSRFKGLGMEPEVSFDLVKPVCPVEESPLFRLGLQRGHLKEDEVWNKFEKWKEQGQAYFSACYALQTELLRRVEDETSSVTLDPNQETYGLTKWFAWTLYRNATWGSPDRFGLLGTREYRRDRGQHSGQLLRRP